MLVEIVRNVKKALNLVQLRSFLGCFIFKQDTSHPINVWSVFDDFPVFIRMFPYKEKIAKFCHALCMY